MAKLRQVSVVGMGLLGASITLALSRIAPSIRTVGFAHRASTRKKARQLEVAQEVTGDLQSCLTDADLIILATPICLFESLFPEIRKIAKAGAVVTDVGSTKRIPHRWADATLGKAITYVGSHPIAGSEKQGVEYARDDLFDRARCIVTRTRSTRRQSVQIVSDFWHSLGCIVEIMSPVQHDRILCNVSHLPHAMAASLVNATDPDELRFCGKGFIDTSRVASGPENIWADIFLTNCANTIYGIDRLIRELKRFQSAVKSGDRKKLERFLSAAREKRATMIEQKVRNKELL
jgi:prephenate dehydrogenase